MPINLKDWIRDVRGKRTPEEVYVDSTTVPDEPAGPYRARQEKAAQERVVEGIEVTERETVSGELRSTVPDPLPMRASLGELSNSSE